MEFNEIHLNLDLDAIDLLIGHIYSEIYRKEDDADDDADDSERCLDQLHHNFIGNHFTITFQCQFARPNKKQ